VAGVYTGGGVCGLIG